MKVTSKAHEPQTNIPLMLLDHVTPQNYRRSRCGDFGEFGPPWPQWNVMTPLAPPPASVACAAGRLTKRSGLRGGGGPPPPPPPMGSEMLAPSYSPERKVNPLGDDQ